MLRYVILILLAVLMMGGCSEAGMPEDTEQDIRNFTLVLDCVDSGRLPVKVSGDAEIDVRDFLKSNCSVNVANRTVTVRCPSRI